MKLSSRRAGVVAALCDAAIALSVISFRPVAAFAARVLPTCPAAAAGLQCATCGATRCLSYLIRFEFADAIVHNFLLVGFLVYFIIVTALLHVCFFSRGRHFTGAIDRMTSEKAVIGWCIALAIFTLIRNIPGTPF